MHWLTNSLHQEYSRRKNLSIPQPGLLSEKASFLIFAWNYWLLPGLLAVKMKLYLVEGTPHGFVDDQRLLYVLYNYLLLELFSTEERLSISQ